MYKAVIIGGGPGGYVAAIRLAKLGYKVALVEKKYLGGTCTNVGCIPTKALLTAAHFYYDILNKGKKFGVYAENVSYDFKGIFKHMIKSVTLSRKGVEYLLKQNKIDYYFDKAIVLDKNHVKLEKENRVLECENLILAHGSVPFVFPPFDSVDGLWTSDNVFSMDNIPDSVLIIGGGVIGVEFSTFFSMLGKKVYLVELFDHMLPSEDTDVAELIKKSLKKNKVSVFESGKVTKVSKNKEKYISVVQTKDDKIEIETDKVILAVGRKANITEDIMNLEIKINKKGIVVNKKMQTTKENVYAIGDITGEFMLAHVAMKEGIVAAENIANIDSEMNYSAVPSIIFSSPEVASTGVKEKNMPDKAKVFKFPLAANARAGTLAEREGFFKAIKDTNTDKLLGFTVVSPVATEMISHGSLGVQLGLEVEKMSKCIFPHPTLSEGIMESLEGVEDKSIHI